MNGLDEGGNIISNSFIYVLGGGEGGDGVGGRYAM